MWPHEPRMYRRRGLRYWVISMLTTSPKNGAEIMNEIEGMSLGWWRPSPGSIYPLLDELAQEGLIKKRDDGRYELAEKGREELGWPFGMATRRLTTVEDVLNEITGYVSYIEDLSRSDRSKVTPFVDRIRGITDRLLALTK
jgi:DNA-binding PadR family transcriptional regulator